MKITYSGGDTCTADPTKQDSFVVQIACDETADTPTYVLDAKSLLTPCTIQVNMVSKAGCPAFSIHTLYRFGVNNKYILATLAMVLGVFLLFFGGLKYKWALFFVSQLATAILLLVSFG